MNAPACVATHLSELFDAMRLFGRNKALVPWAMDYHEGQFWVYVDINSRFATWDAEISDDNLEVALTNAIARVRREAQLSGAAAA